jgi:hypothetical protein
MIFVVGLIEFKGHCWKEIEGLRFDLTGPERNLMERIRIWAK